MKNLKSFVLYLLLVGGVYAQSNLPACQDNDPSKWSNCFGTATYNIGKYVGEYKDGKQNGQGTFTFADGNKYTGEWLNGNANGQGTTTYTNGAKHVGEYKDGKQNGQGTSSFTSGANYVGEFRDGRHNGQGTYNFANGNKYVGEYKDGKLTGQGTFTIPDGRFSIGEWKDGKPHARMIEYLANKTVFRSGIHEDGKFIREENINPDVFTRIAPK